VDQIVKDHADGATIAVRVAPRASRTELAGRHGDALKIRLAAPPVDGAANAELIRLVARLVGVARSDVSIIRGGQSRDKLVLVAGVDAWQLRSVLADGI
jgi:hypothetical protein